MKTILCLHSSADLYGSDRSLLRLVTGGLPHRFIVVLPYEGPLCDALRAEGGKLPARRSLGEGGKAETGDLKGGKDQEDRGQRAEARDQGKRKGATVDVVVFPLAVIRRNLMNPVGLVKLGLSFLRTAWFLRNLIAKEGVDLVLANTTAVLGGEVAAKLAGAQYFQYVREIIVSPKLVAKFFSWRAILATKVICVSEGTKRAFVEHCPRIKDKTIVVNNGIEVGKYLPKRDETRNLRPEGLAFREELGVSEQTVLIGAIGRISKFKGMGFFVDGAAEFFRKHPEAEVRFVVVGSAFRQKPETGPSAVALAKAGNLKPEELLPPEEELLEQIQRAETGKLKPEDYITWLPFREDIVEVMHGLDVFVLPSMLPDPFPTVVLEAMICGKPVIGTNHGGVPEMLAIGEQKDEVGNLKLEDREQKLEVDTATSAFPPSPRLRRAGRFQPSGFLVSPGDTESLAEAMGVLVDNPDLRQAMGEAGRRRCLENFTRDIYMERISEVLSDG
jgi:glycosyltransferase involved in cell wall biosynthesis